MPKRVWLYLTAMLYYRTSASCMALAEGLQTVSHDGLTRLLQAVWSGQALLELALRMRFVCERGDLILANTVLPKPFATAIEDLAWEWREAPMFLDILAQRDIRWSIEGQFPHSSLFTWLPRMLSRPIWP
jgi:hypothetical protein